MPESSENILLKFTSNLNKGIKAQEEEKNRQEDALIQKLEGYQENEVDGEK